MNLQGIKKGIMEMADAVAINKADGVNKISAELAVTEYQNALHLFPKSDSDFITKVLTCSALERSGISSLWELINEYQHVTLKNGYFEKNRQAQNLEWMHDYIRQTLEDQFYENTIIKKSIASLEKSVREGNELPVAVAERLLDIFRKNSLK